jgi:hypothetical protein
VARVHFDQFHDMIRKTDEAKLDAWIANARTTLVSSLATGVLKDRAAVARCDYPTLVKMAGLKRRSRNSNSSNDKCMAE